MNIKLESLIGYLGETVGEPWRQLALAKLPAPSAGILFACWLLKQAGMHTEGGGREVIDNVYRLYMRLLQNDMPTPDQWNTARVDSWTASATAQRKFSALYKAAAWAAEGYLMAAAEEASLAIDCDQQLKRLLLYMQLVQTPRDRTEAGLQQAVLENESALPVYCDYLEESHDPTAYWLRMLLNSE